MARTKNANKIRDKKNQKGEIISLTFEVIGRPIGNSCYILVPKSMRGKKLKVHVDVIE